MDDLWAKFDDLEIGDTAVEANVKECPECKEPIDKQSINNGYIVCDRCGGVLNAFIDTAAEWRTFSGNSKGQDQARCSESKNPLLPDSFKMNTYIGDGPRRLQRVHQWNNMSTRERMLHQMNKEFEEVTQSNGLPTVVYKSMCEYYYAVYNGLDERNYGVKKCNVREGLKAACVFYACKQHRVPREIKEIAKMLNMPRKVVTQGCNLFAEVMGDEFMKQAPFKPMDFAERYCAALGFSFQMTKIVKEMLEWLESRRLMHENTPPSVTAAVIYRLLQTTHPPKSTPTTDVEMTVDEKIMAKKPRSKQRTKRTAEAADTADMKRVQSVCGVSKAILAKLVKRLEDFPELHQITQT